GINKDRSRSSGNILTSKRLRPVATVREEENGFISSLFGITDLSINAYRSCALTRRLPACLRFLRANDVQQASLKIWDNPALATAALNVVLLGVTDFFRDRAVFDLLRGKVLPLLFG